MRGYCAMGYKPGDEILVERFYINSRESANICIHAFSAMITFLAPLLKGVSARALGISKDRDEVGYVQCPDPGPPMTRGGSVVFELIREKIRDQKSEEDKDGEGETLI